MDEWNEHGGLDRRHLIEHSQPVRRPWITWAASLLLLCAAFAGPFAYRWMSHPKGLPPTRQHNGRTVVFIPTPGRHDGEWLPLEDTTDSPLLWLIHQRVPDGKVAHVNEDGTVLITDAAAGTTRAIRQAEQGLHGWPPP
jgi:hypothetical protein